METLANLECFAKSAELGSFSQAARRLALTPAAVSRNVSVLERNLGLRLFHRSTRKLALTEAGESFLQAMGGPLEELQTAIAEALSGASEPAGVLKVSLPPSLGMMHVLPLLPGFMARYPRIRPEWHFENRPVDLLAEGYDAAIGGGFELPPGVVARELAVVRVIAVASPSYMKGRTPPADPSGLAQLSGIVMRSLKTGRIRASMMRDTAGSEMPAPLPETIIVNDPAAVRNIALLGLGVALLAIPDVQPDLERGALVRLLPGWYADAGALSLYYASRSLLPAKTRAFADFVVEAFKRQRLAQKFAETLG
jgi:DNA-binding transcriptional LysR family regulator